MSDINQEIQTEAMQPEQAVTAVSTAEMYEVVDIRFRNNTKTYFFSPEGLQIAAGDHVIIDTARGDEFGYCVCGNHRVPGSEVVPPLRRVIRMATAQDERMNDENQAREKQAYDVCLKKIAEHQLDMQLVSAECAFDGSKILFFFTADGRVDFRELVKDLAAVFRTRIELRQIGVRDKAKMVGGLGICGRPFCCKEFLDDFQPCSIKMAKTQNLSLNPTKISGTCGRLMCCLKYEQEAYEDLLKNAPKTESFVDTPDGRGTVTEVNLLRQSVRVRMEDHPETIGTYKNEDIFIIRSGKAKKTDAPIPRDFAPLSSGRKSTVSMREALEDMPQVVYADEVVEVKAPAAVSAAEEGTEQEQQPEKAEKKSGSRRRRRGHGQKKPANPETAGQQHEKAAQKPQTEQRKQNEQHQGKKNPQESSQKEQKHAAVQVKAPGTAETGDKKSNRSRRHRYHSHKKPGGQKPAGGPGTGSAN